MKEQEPKRKIKINKFTIYVLEKFGLDFLIDLYMTLKNFFDKENKDVRKR